MSDTLTPKPIRASRVTISQLMHPEHANLLGNVHGGWIMKLVDEAWVGDATEVRADELPLFWACGVTPQSVVRNARPPLCITHAPGHMLVTDLRNSSLAVL